MNGTETITIEMIKCDTVLVDPRVFRKLRKTSFFSMLAGVRAKQEKTFKA